MITREQMFAPLIEALPSFRPAWEKFIAHWTPKPGEYSDLAPGEYPNYLLLGELADHLADLLQRDQLDDVARALAVCERWLLEGEPYVRDAAAVGLIEDLQNVAQRLKIPPQLFYALFGPEGKFWWDKLNGFWSKGELLVDERKLTPTEQARFGVDSVLGKVIWDQGRKAK